MRYYLGHSRSHDVPNIRDRDQDNIQESPQKSKHEHLYLLIFNFESFQAIKPIR